MGRKVNDGADQLLLADALVDTRSKTVGERIFSANGKKPGNNHHRYGGNLMFSDGHVQDSRPEASSPITLPAGVTLLNPKP
jgi:hypothetical protein